MTSVASLGTHLLINGELVSDVGSTIDVINPSTGEVARTVPQGGIAEADFALNAARRAFDDGDWALLPPSRRAEILTRLGDLVEAHTADFAHFVETEVGTCRRVAGPAQVVRPMDHYRDMVAKGTGDLGYLLPDLPGRRRPGSE